MRVARGSAALLTVAALTGSACAPALFRPPAGPGSPAPDAATALDNATAACRDVRSLVFIMHLHGRIAGRGIPGALRFDGAATRDGGLFLDANANGRQYLELRGTPGAASLWLRDGNRLVNAPLTDILEALTGLAIAPDRLLAFMTGCVTWDRSIVQASRFGRDIRVRTSDAEIVLVTAPAGWRTRWGVSGGLVVDYHEMQGLWPRRFTIYPEATAGEDRLTMQIDQRFVNDARASNQELFTPRARPGSVPMTVEELREAVWRDP
ncbi:MAG: hypothetical protein R2752_07905 [Vicinamibacterales bacterium]